MSKKSYKRNQNRLYREIKRRIFAEKRADNLIITQSKTICVNRDIETLKVRNIVPDYIEQTKEYLEYVKSNMVKQITQRLIEDGYLKFNYCGKYIQIAEDEEVMDIKEIEATLNVARPWD